MNPADGDVDFDDDAVEEMEDVGVEQTRLKYMNQLVSPLLHPKKRERERD